MSAGPILEFRGEYRFLSNFAPSPLVVPQWPAVKGEPRMHPASGERAPTVEHAFQALKCVDGLSVQRVLDCEMPEQAKRAGRSVPMRPDWEAVKQDVMLACLRRKFDPFRDTPEHATALLGTGYRMLVEGNTWGDTTWGAVWRRAGSGGVGPCWARAPLDVTTEGVGTRELRGENWLGRLLMLVRAELDCGARP